METNFRKNAWMVLVACILAIAPTMTLWAADLTARIRGTVTDSTGAVVANAAITATNTGTGLTYKASSGNTGNFEVPSLPIGTYTVTVEVPGFQKYRFTGVTLNIDQKYVLDVTLKVATGEETVEVSASAVQVDTTNLQLGAVINNQQIVGLPLIGRNFTQLQLLLPGVQASSDRMGTFSANGQQTQQSNFLVNGTDTNDWALNTPLYIPSLDAIEQFNFATNTINAEYGRNSGGIVSAAIKSGSNSFHGSAFEFYRDTFLNARNFFQRPTATSDGVPVFHQNLFGGTLGGPILKDKAFGFFSFQGIRGRTLQASQNVTVYTAAQRTGDFSTNLAFLDNSTCLTADPDDDVPACFNLIPGTIGATLGAVNAACMAGNLWSQCFTATGGLIPGGAASFNPVAATLLANFVPGSNDGTSGFRWNPTTKVPWTRQFIGKVDVNLSERDLLWGSFTLQRAPTSSDLPFSGANLPGFGSTNQSHVKQGTLSWTHTFNTTTLNELRVGYTRLNFKSNFPQQVVLPSSVGFAITPEHPEAAGLPNATLTGFFTLGFTSNGPQPRIDENRQFADNFTKIVGNHSLKFGVDVRRFNVRSQFLAVNNGSYGFGGAGQFSTGNPGVDFLLGNPDSYSQGSGALLDVQAWQTYSYAQDVWKVRPSLTLTLGLGWQVDQGFHSRQYGGIGVACYIPGQQTTVFPTSGLLGPPPGINYPGDPGCDDANGVKTQWKNFGPRVGFAWSPDLGWLSAGNSGKFVVRGGVGMYYNRSDEEQALQNLQPPPFGITSSGAGDFGASVPAFANPYQDIDTGTVFPNPFPSTPVAAGDLIAFPNIFFLAQASPNQKVPYSINYNLTIQRELPANIVATVSYVGSVARRLATVGEGNPITQAGHDLCLVTPACVAFRNFQPEVFPTHTQFGDGDIFPAVGLVTSQGKSNYNALQVSAKKGRSHGLIFQASYTYSHALDDASSFENAGFGGFGGTPVRGYNQFDNSFNYGNSGFDARHRFVFSPLYDIPNWKGIRGMSWMPDVIGKGWKVSGILTLASGFPFDISYAGGSSRSLFCAHFDSFYACPGGPVQMTELTLHDPRDLVSGAGTDNSCWFTGGSTFSSSVGGSTRCGVGTTFVTAPLGSFGNVGRNKYHGPGINNIDVLVGKDIYFWPGNENRYIELRFEMYNALNHTQFALPSGAITSTNFGRITAAAAGRTIQIAAKFYF